MTQRSRHLAAVLGLSAVAAFSLAASPAAAAPISGSYIVTLNAGDPDAVAASDARRYGASVDHVYRHAVRGYTARMSATAAQRIASLDRVQSVVQDQTVSIDAQTLPTGINRIDGELSSTVSGNGSGAVDADIAIIDTGIDLTHPDLNVVGGVNCSTGRSYADGNGHGTHIAGTAAAKDDANGVVGVAPGARLYAVRVLNNQGSGSWSSIICGIDWVTARASTIDVANMSLGGTGSDSACNDGGMHQAICNSVNAGITYAVAAGNESDDAKNHVPAAYDQVITVSALADFNGLPGGGAPSTCRADVDETFADFSNYGADVDIIAPGVCILSTWKSGGYNTISGTSMATPHVTGAAALYKSTNPGGVAGAGQERAAGRRQPRLERRHRPATLRTRCCSTSTRSRPSARRGPGSAGAAPPRRPAATTSSVDDEAVQSRIGRCSVVPDRDPSLVGSVRSGGLPLRRWGARDEHLVDTGPRPARHEAGHTVSDGTVGGHRRELRRRCAGGRRGPGSAEGGRSDRVDWHGSPCGVRQRTVDVRGTRIRSGKRRAKPLPPRRGDATPVRRRKQWQRARFLGSPFANAPERVAEAVVPFLRLAIRGRRQL